VVFGERHADVVDVYLQLVVQICTEFRLCRHSLLRDCVLCCRTGLGAV
jgi:hypothetical protein